MSNQPNTKISSKENKNPFEAISNFGQSTVNNAFDSFKKIGSGMINQLVGYHEVDNNNEKNNPEKLKKQIDKLKKEKKQGNIFRFTEYQENVLIKKQIKELTEQVKREIETIKKTDKSLLAEVKEVEKLTINDLPEKPGVYHIRFLEIVLSILRAVRAKVSESKTWLQALISKKKKRGSLFAIRTKEKGTQYSLSQELQVTRSIQ